MKKYFYLYVSALFAALGGLLFGYDTGVISGALLYIKNSFPINSTLLGLLVSSVSIGAVAGALVNGFFVDKIGRKNTFLLTAFIFMSGSVLCFFSQNIFQLILSRMLVGCAVGIVSFVGPLYLGEISPKEKRGQIVSFHQLAITLGILFSYLVNYFCANSALNWRLMLLFGAFPAFVLLVAMVFQNDTPRWLILRGKIGEAKKVLLKYDQNADVDSEINEILSSTQKNDLKFNKKLFMPLVIGIGIMFCQIAIGINAIIYYTPTLFKMAGFTSDKSALFATIFIGLTNFLMTFVAIALVDKMGRKPLLYFGLSGMLVSLLVLAGVFVFDFSFAKYLALIFSAVYILSFSFSIGPIGLLLVSEVFPLNYRGMAMSIAIVSNFIFNFIVTGSFPILLDKLGGSVVFLIFASICVFSLAFVYFLVPETKGVSLEEIEKKWN